MYQFNHNFLEQDIERLSKEVAEKRNLPEYKELTEKELVKKALEPLVKPPVQSIEQGVQSIESAETVFLPDYLKDSPAEVKLRVEKLVDSVFHQGIKKTVKEAKGGGAFVLDAFHDALTDKLYEELKKRKLI